MIRDHCTSCGQPVDLIQVEGQEQICDGPFQAIRSDQKPGYPGRKTGRVLDVYGLHTCKGPHEYTVIEGEEDTCQICGLPNDRPWHTKEGQSTDDDSPPSEPAASDA